MPSIPNLLKKTLSWLFATLGCVGGASLLAYVGAFPGPGSWWAVPPAPKFSATLSEWSLTLCVMSIGLLSILAALVAMRRPRVASLLLLVPAAVLVTVWAINLPRNAGTVEHWPDYDLDYLPVWAWLFLLVVPGFFWYVAAGLRWPPTLSSPVAWWKGTAVAVLISISVLAGVFILDSRVSYFSSCHVDVPLFAEQTSPEQVVFIARIMSSGYIYPTPEYRGRPGTPSKQWALAWVEQEHWGLPWWDKKFVFLYAGTNSGRTAFPNGERYFVDGYRQPGALSRFLPIFGTNCTRTQRLASAEFELRVLREGAPRNGVRIMGRTVRLTPERTWESVPGAQFVIRSSAGRMNIVSDQNGSYDTGEVAPGSYEIYDNPRDYGPRCSWRQLKVGEIRSCTVIVE